MEENKNKSMVIIIIILSLLLIGITGYIVYDKVIKNSDNESYVQKNEQNDNNDNSSDKEEGEKNLEVSLAEAKSVYYRIFYGNMEEKIKETLKCSSGYNYPREFYGNEKYIIKEEIDYDFLMSFSYSYIPADQIVKEKTKTKFLVKNIKKIYESYFGENNNWQSFNAWLGTCNVEGEYYVCKNDDTPFGDECYPDQGILTSFVKYETDKENLYVYDKSIYYQVVEDEMKFYDSEDSNVEITELKGKDKNIILDDSYSDKMVWYKHTFKQNTDGTFYLYSTEPISKNN